jgi:hypothetical protein
MHLQIAPGKRQIKLRRSQIASAHLRATPGYNPIALGTTLRIAYRLISIQGGII